MPDWNQILKEIGASLAAAAREANTQRRSSQSRPTQQRGRSFEVVYGSNRCLFWDCKETIRDDHILCYDHFLDLRDGLIDECEGCGLAKAVQYDLCLDCNSSRPRSPRANKTASKPAYKWYKPEYSPTWDKADKTASRFFVYILKLREGNYYAGQTRELRERLQEHRDNRTKSTAGRNPKLVWFMTVNSREQATETEVELKKLIDANPRQIGRMVLDFKDLTGELDYS